ncbi:uncharacterized protein [Arachis hypogaea]|uniref:uncharacterized protein isoform X1 n=1 Tax=Arachis hypogaea TaxID=3818 RepID=UPI000DEC9564|nr:dnaJ homolog subfamily B member 7 isoform X1 [Arachis hypogaea]
MSSVVESKSDGCYYSVLGVRKHSTDHEIRCAYRKMALKWHPDRWIKEPKLAVEAKKQFQHIQEAYSVLSNKGKRMIYDAGMFGFIGEDDDEVCYGFVDFMQEMVLTMQKVKHQGEKCMMEDFQGILMDMIAESDEGSGKSGLCWSSSNSPKKKTRIL